MPADPPSELPPNPPSELRPNPPAELPSNPPAELPAKKRADLRQNRQWMLAAPWGGAVLIGMLAAAVGLVLGRVDVVVLGCPLLLVGAAALLKRRSAGVSTAVDRQGAPHSSGRVRFALDVDGAGDLVMIHLRDGRSGTNTLVITGRETSTHPEFSGAGIVADLPLSGHHEILTVQFQGLSPDMMSIQPPITVPPVEATVLPPLQKLPGGPLPHRLRGRNGSHGSRTPGEGSEFRDIHPFQPGDRLRRIDWRATARRPDEAGGLYVRRTFATAEATVTLIVDANEDLESDATGWFAQRSQRVNEVSSLHLLREAAASVAAGYLNQGDRVGINELATYQRGLRAGSGRRQLELIRSRLTALHAGAPAQRYVHDLNLEPGCVAIIFSTFLNDDAARSVAKWQQLGHVVVGVDILPWLTRLPSDHVQQLAVRLELLARATKIAQLGAIGVPVLGWRGVEAPRSLAKGLDVIDGQLPLAAGLQILGSGRSSGRISGTARAR